VWLREAEAGDGPARRTWEWEWEGAEGEEEEEEEDGMDLGDALGEEDGGRGGM
jgi:hypothetical protein